MSTTNKTKRQNKKSEDKMEASIDRSLDAVVEIVNQYKNESLRAAVILAAARMDILLYQLLARVFVPNTSIRDDLFDGEAPLSTFSAKINLSYRLKLIAADLTRALHIFRKTRNAFAHETAECQIESGPHRDRIKEIITACEVNPTFDKMASLVKKISLPDRPDFTVRFYAAMSFMIMKLEIANLMVTPLGDKDMIPHGPVFLSKTFTPHD